jgi:hypothetical protein
MQRPNVTSILTSLTNLEPNTCGSPYSAEDLSSMMKEIVAPEILKDTAGSVTHAFVLSPLPQTCASMLRKATSWPIHQVQFGYSHEAPVSHNQAEVHDWCFEWDAAHASTLHMLIHSAREGNPAQELSHVRVSINSTEPCRVEKLLTPPRKTKLHPGQCTKLFAKVRIPPSKTLQTSAPTSLESLFDELQGTLGCVKTALFKADVQYRHSILPRDTELRTEQACELIRTNRDSEWSMARGNDEKGGSEVELEKAKFAARHYPPEVAMKILHKKFGTFWSGNDGPAILRQLREELEFQQKACKVVAQLSTTTTRRQALRLHFPDVEALQVFNTAPSTPTPDEGSAEPVIPYGEDFPNPGQKQDSMVQDEARRIWRHMRRNSRTTSGYSAGSDASSRVGSDTLQYQEIQRRGSQESVVDRMAAADTRINEIRRKAIQNKRSVGAETLRDFGLMQQQQDEDSTDELRYEACAPWL